MMKQRLMRPTSALFPVVGIVGAVWGNSTSVIGIFLCYYLMQLCSLCAADCFRNAAAQEPGVRRVDERFSGAFLPLLFGMCFTWILWQFILPPSWTIGAWQFATAAAALISIEHLFEERMFTLGRRMDGVILSCVANGLLLTGLLLKTNVLLVAATGLSALIAIVTNYVIEPLHGFSLKPANLGSAPRAMVQTLTYVAATVALTVFSKVAVNKMLLPILFGLIPWRLARTVCRRSQDESRPLNLLLIAFAAVATAASVGCISLQPFALAACITLLCATVIFCAPSEKLYGGIIIIALSFLTPFIVSIVLSLAAIVLNARQAFMKKV